MLTFNLGQADRVVLRQRIGTGGLPATELSEMSSADLANEQAKQDMEKAAQEALHQSILKVQTALPRAKITHKGEEIIENNASEDLQQVRDEEDRERMRMRMRVRTGSIVEGGAEPVSGITSAGLSSSIFDETKAMELDNLMPTSPVQSVAPPSTVTRPVLSPISPVTAVTGVNFTQSPVHEFTSPTDETQGSPRVGLLAPRPSFDLNALWAGQKRDNKTKPATTTAASGLESTAPGIGGLPEDTETPMDLEDDVVEDQDFGMFLEGVEEKTKTPVGAKSTTPPLPVTDKDVYKGLPTVWSGDVSLSCIISGLSITYVPLAGDATGPRSRCH